MPAAPPTLSTPPTRVQMLDGDLPSRWWREWFEQLFLRVGGANGRPVAGDVAGFETTVDQADLASGGSVSLLAAKAGERWKVRNILLSGGGTNFSGGGGDRLLSVSDGTSTWTVIPAATLQSLAAARWGDTAAPFPATAAHLTAASVAGTNISAAYSGGSADYTAGSCTLVLIAERTA